MDAGESGELLVVEPLELPYVAGDDLEDVFGVNEEALHAQGVGHAGDGVLECSHRVAVPIAHRDENQGLKGEAECLGVQLCPVAADGPRLLKSPQPAVAGRQAQPHALSQIGQ